MERKSLKYRQVHLYLLFFFVTHSMVGQFATPLCLSSESFSSGNCGDDACFSQFNVNEIPALPSATIQLDFHFVRSGGNNFQCTNPLTFDYAPTYVEKIIFYANGNFADPLQNQYGTSPDIPDARIRYQLYGNPSDPCQAIFFHDDNPTSFSNPDALHIVVFDNGSIGIAGQQAADDKIYLLNIHRAVFEYNLTPDEVGTNGAAILNHEVGHLFGLCHAFSTYNVCPDMNPAAECGGPSATECVDALGNVEPCPTVPPNSAYPLTCGYNECLGCYCTWGTGNNFMGYNGSMRGMALSQWAQMYGTIIAERPPFVVFTELSCTDVPPHPPLEIPSNTTVEWNTFTMLNQHVEVRPGATLIIRCKVWVAKDLPIIVNRGARLFVLGGEITSQSPDCRWGGIIVHGNAAMNQPDIDDARDISFQLDHNGPGVVWLNGAILSNAYTAISTKASGSLDTHDYYGGLVMVDNSDFIDNGRAVEFMKYGRENNSYFSFCDIFRNGTPSPSVNRGVTIWACHGIEFFQTHFDKIKDEAISGINYSANLELCSFKGSTYAFKSESTMPNIALSTTTINRCDFGVNRYDMYCNASPNMIYGFEITDNDFFDGYSLSYGIRIIGESSFNIRDGNTFEDEFFSTYVNATGNFFNQISCNTYTTHSPVGVFSVFNNSNLEILGNDFKGSGGTEIRVSGNDSQSGIIGLQQGDGNMAAGNCFINPVKAITTTGPTVPFSYFVHNLQNPEYCEKPTNNQYDGGSNNYYLEDADNEMVDCGSGEPPRDVTEGDLFNAREITAIKKSAWEADPTDEQKRSEYLMAATEQDYILRVLVSQAFNIQDLDKAEVLMLGENTNAYRRGVVGLRTLRGNIAGAQSLLNNMVVENQDDIWFKDIMAINFAIEQSPVLYELNAEQETVLLTIANTPHSIMRGYACALLSLCKGYTCEEIELIEEFVEGEERSQTLAAARGQVSSYPNPTAGLMTLECPILLGETISLDISNISGRHIKGLDFINTGKYTLDQSDLINGAYVLRLYHNGQLFYTTPVIVIH